MTKARDLANAATALSAVDATELAFVDGVTSAIQTQMDAKAPSSTAVTLTGTQTLTNKTLTNPVISSVINNTLTSTTGDIIYASSANTPARLGIGSTAQVLTVSSGIPAWATPASSSGPTFSANKTASQTLSGNTTTKVTFTGTPKWDTDSCFDTTNSRFTPNKAGYYLISGTIYVAGSPIYLVVRKNGNDADDYGVGSSAGTYAPNFSSIWYLNGSTDYVELFCYPNNASAQTALSYPNARFQGTFLRS